MLLNISVYIRCDGFAKLTFYPRRMILSASSQRRIDSRTESRTKGAATYTNNGTNNGTNGAATHTNNGTNNGTNGAATGEEGDFGGEQALGGRGEVSVSERNALGTYAEHDSVGGAAAATPGRAILAAGRGQKSNTGGEQGREPGREIQNKPLLVHPRNRRRRWRGRGHGRGAHAALSPTSNIAETRSDDDDDDDDDDYHDDFEGGDLGGDGGSVYVPTHAVTWPPALPRGGHVADVDGIVPRRPASATGSNPLCKWGHRHRHQQRALRAYEKAVAVTSSVRQRFITCIYSV